MRCEKPKMGISFVEFSYTGKVRGSVGALGDRTRDGFLFHRAEFQSASYKCCLDIANNTSEVEMKTRGRAGICSVFLSSPDAGLSEDVHLHHAVPGG